MGTRIASQLNDDETAADAIEVRTTTLDVMRSKFQGTAGAYAYLLFILIYAPCVAAIAAIYKETSLGWAAFSTAYLTILAWVVSTLFFRFATIGSNPGASFFWIAIAGSILGGMWLTLKGISRSGKLRA
jgi:ferrous iron transport protein B